MDYDSVSEEDESETQKDKEMFGKDRQKKRKKDLHSTRQVELALAVSIILSNLSNDEDYIKTLLGVNHWKQRLEQEIQEGVGGVIGGTSDDIVINQGGVGQPKVGQKVTTDAADSSLYDDAFILRQPEV